jgi:hypothetical protein
MPDIHHRAYIFSSSAFPPVVSGNPSFPIPSYMDSPLFASGIHNCEERVCCHISGFFSGTSKVPSLDGCRAAAPMHSHGLINQPMTIIRFCCCGGDHFRPSVGVSCYAIQGEKNLMKLFFYAPPPLYEILMANALGQFDICDAVLKGGVHTIIPDMCYRESICDFFRWIPATNTQV